MDCFLGNKLQYYSISAIAFVFFCSKNVGCLWRVARYVCQSYDIIVFHSEYILTVVRLSKI